ncbi:MULTISPECIES: type II RES/Xre toxin-antitoxin system antitoxin [unclassified Agarivorans]|uniref:type II RES/Xre toxin-antitoxin system antitoxin n=1 Tax=unclassified Agarivorans TaxID=2636026 RepID=UPI003D7CD3B5
MYESAYQMLSGTKVKIGSVPEILTIIRTGLPVSILDSGTDLLGVNKTEYAQLIGANLRSIQRKQQTSGKLSPASSEHALMLAELVRLADEYFKDRDATLRWLNRPSLAFGHYSPLSVCDTVTGINVAMEEINKMKYGFTA